MIGVSLSKIRENVIGCAEDAYFRYGETNCGIVIHAYNKFSILYGDKEFKYSSFDELINDPVFDGKSFSEIVETVDFYEYAD
jgi:hypothetical protein